MCTLNVQKWEIEYIKYKNLCTLHKKLCSLNIEIKKFAYIEHTKSCVLFEKKKMYVEFETCVLWKLEYNE